jgi:hypothetical protein
VAARPAQFFAARAARCASDWIPNVTGTLYPIQTGSFSEKSTRVIIQRRSVVVPAGSILQFSLGQPVTVKK